MFRLCKVCQEKLRKISSMHSCFPHLQVNCCEAYTWTHSKELTPYTPHQTQVSSGTVRKLVQKKNRTFPEKNPTQFNFFNESLKIFWSSRNNFLGLKITWFLISTTKLHKIRRNSKPYLRFHWSNFLLSAELSQK